MIIFYPTHLIHLLFKLLLLFFKLGLIFFNYIKNKYISLVNKVL